MQCVNSKLLKEQLSAQFLEIVSLLDDIYVYYW